MYQTEENSALTLRTIITPQTSYYTVNLHSTNPVDSTSKDTPFLGGQMS